MFFVIILLASSAFGQVRTDGIVVDAQTQKPIAGVAIHVDGGETCISDSLGKFYFSVSGKTAVTLFFAHIAYKPQVFANVKTGGTLPVFSLTSRTYDLTEITIAGVVPERKGTNLGLSSIDIKQAIPVLGEANVVLTLQQKAGVAHAHEINPGLFVRGLSSSQNKVFLNGAPIFNSNHTLGIFPSINAKALSKVELLNDDVHPKYGDFLSACLIMEGNSQVADSSELMLGIGGLTSHVYSRAPTVKGKMSYMVAARRSYFDLVANYYNRKYGNESGSNRLPDYRLYDINGSIVIQPTKEDKIVVTGYYSDDKLKQERFGVVDLVWGNTMATLSWEKKLTDAFTIKLSVDDCHYNTTMKLLKVERNQVVNRIGRHHFNLDGVYRVGKDLQFDAGVFAAHMQTAISNNSREFNGNESVLDSMAGGYRNWGGYAAINVWPWRHLQLKGGLRMENYDQSQFYFSPRIFVQSPVTSALTVFAAFSHRQQFDHLYEPMGINLPIDMVIPSRGKIKPQKSHYYSAGVKVRMGDQAQVTASAYYSKLRNQVDFVNPEPLYQGFYYTVGRGTSRGAELSVSYQGNWLGVEASYSFSESLRQFAQINQGRWFHPPFDVTHKVDLLANLQLSRRLRLQVAQFLQSGTRITIPTSIYVTSGGDLVPVFTTRYNLQLPLAHRLDVALHYSVVRSYGSFSCSVGVYNAYNQANPYFIYFDPVPLDNKQRAFVTKKRSMLPMVPFIMIEFLL
ncbi:TonB-dependent receptor domain-containing protein [uncultured Acetobacteroides sp.]|uniref:TonB-dependent receptor n=1 Tax=uncultured Acetobacteroides sp. TaxID=1760811 RepID=UPI0029F56D62|nr:TonB-dependent receptor [uncultured Acetobacteroides sp.]